MICRRCHEELLPEDFRRLRKQRHGVCKACEHLAAYEHEMRAREKRLAEMLCIARENRLRYTPDD